MQNALNVGNTAIKFARAARAQSDVFRLRLRGTSGGAAAPAAAGGTPSSIDDIKKAGEAITGTNANNQVVYTASTGTCTVGSLTASSQ